MHTAKMQIQWTRLDPDRHRLAIVRGDGSRENRALDTRSFLLHDLVHYAIESEAGLQGGFYGRVAAGAGLEDVDSALSGEALAIEQLAGAMTGLLHADPPPSSAAFVTQFTAYLNQCGSAVPDWLSTAYVDRVRERLRRLLGQWRAIPFGETMALEFP